MCFCNKSYYFSIHKLYTCFSFAEQWLLLFLNIMLISCLNGVLLRIPDTVKMSFRCWKRFEKRRFFNNYDCQNIFQQCYLPLLTSNLTPFCWYFVYGWYSCFWLFRWKNVDNLLSFIHSNFRFCRIFALWKNYKQ